MQLPYELIGKVVVYGVGTAIAVLAIGVMAFGAIIVWSRWWWWVSNSMWDGNDPREGETPTLWRSRIAGVSAALAMFKFHKIRAVYQEATERARDS